MANPESRSTLRCWLTAPCVIPNTSWLGARFGVVSHLLSLANNWRLRVRTFAADDDFPIVPSLIDVWPAVNWFEREAFDLYGVMFPGHPDLRRLLTDYGFEGQIGLESPAVREFWRERHLCTLTTLRADGSPHVVPVWFVLDELASRIIKL